MASTFSNALRLYVSPHGWVLDDAHTKAWVAPGGTEGQVLSLNFWISSDASDLQKCLMPIWDEISRRRKNRSAVLDVIVDDSWALHDLLPDIQGIQTLSQFEQTAAAWLAEKMNIQALQWQVRCAWHSKAQQWLTALPNRLCEVLDQGARTMSVRLGSICTQSQLLWLDQPRAWQQEGWHIVDAQLCTWAWLIQNQRMHLVQRLVATNPSMQETQRELSASALRNGFTLTAQEPKTFSTSHMPALDIQLRHVYEAANFAPSARRWGWVDLMTGLRYPTRLQSVNALLAVLALVALVFFSSAQQQRRWQLQSHIQALVSPEQMRQDALPEPADVMRLNTIISQLNLPWAGILGALEAAHSQSAQRVSLSGLELSPARNGLLVQLEAVNQAAVQDYLKLLKQDQRIASVNILRQELAENKSEVGAAESSNLRLQLDIRWLMPSLAQSYEHSAAAQRARP